MGIGLDKSFEDVKAFHLAFKHPAPSKPTMQPLDRAEKRGDWISEEVQELKDARTLTDQADAYIDIIYFGVGGLVELGIKPERLWQIVQNANMAKLHNINGVLTPVVREDGKVIKPEGWVKPEPLLEEEVNRQIKAANDNL